MQVGKVDSSKEVRLVIQDGLLDCCDTCSDILVLWYGWYDDMIQVGMLDWCSGRGSRLLLLVGMLDWF